MQANASSKMAYKEWCVVNIGAYLLCVSVKHADALVWHRYMVNVTGASPAYLETVIEELNILINATIYNLRSIHRVED